MQAIERLEHLRTERETLRKRRAGVVRALHETSARVIAGIDRDIAEATRRFDLAACEYGD